jgi:hypothetical protein
MGAGETRISTSLDQTATEEIAGDAAAAGQPAAGAGQRLGRMQRVDARNLLGGGEDGLAEWLRSSPNLLGEVLRLEIGPAAPGHPEAIGQLPAGVPVFVDGRFEDVSEGDIGELAAVIAEIDAAVLVMIAPVIPESVRDRLHKLDRNTSKLIVFFGVEFELWQIDDSAPAPLFRVVVGPAGWDKHLETGGEKSIEAALDAEAVQRTLPATSPSG